MGSLLKHRKLKQYNIQTQDNSSFKLSYKQLNRERGNVIMLHKAYSYDERISYVYTKSTKEWIKLTYRTNG